MNTLKGFPKKEASKWMWKKWDTRSDGKIFWKYNKSCRNGERWITWEQALIEKKKESEAALRNYHKNSEKIKKQRKNKWKENLEENRKKKNDQTKKRRRANPMSSIAHRLSSRIRDFIRHRNYLKTSKTSVMIGCQWDELKNHIESKFVDDMSWSNRHLWHIDHIVPLARAKSEEEMIKLSHYTNLQPLWAEDNFKKGAKF
jgi:hypothetical protein